MKNLHIYPKTDEERKRLVEEYEYLGYYVTSTKDKITVHALKPRKKVKKDEEKRGSESSRRSESSSRGRKSEVSKGR